MTLKEHQAMLLGLKRRYIAYLRSNEYITPRDRSRIANELITIDKDVKEIRKQLIIDKLNMLPLSMRGASKT